jgi:isopenicillin-N epimerase
MSPPLPLHRDLRLHWELAPDVTFLNHGSFGATPREISALADDWRRRIEAEPVEIMGRRWPELVAEAKRPVATFLNANPDHLGFVTNATEGVNAVLRSLVFDPKDKRNELVTTSHVYHAIRQSMKFTAKQAGAVYQEIDVPLPAASGEQIVERIIAGLSERTKLLVLDHVTSPTALIFPVEPIARACREREIDLLVDGAHAPGMIPLDLESLGQAGVTFYTGNLHKWCCAVKGTAFLWARADRANDVHPAVISHWYGEGLSAEFHWQGTRDHAGWLTAGAAIDWIGQWGWERVRAHNDAMATWAHAMLCDRLDVEPVSPRDGSLLGSMATVRLPPPLDGMDDEQTKRLQQSLYTDHRIEMPLVSWGGRKFLRVSCQIYNLAADYERVAEVMATLRARGAELSS